MIPLLITFLSVLQISTGVIARTVSTNVVQGAVATEAMKSGAQSNTGLTPYQYELPGGGTLTIGTQAMHKPAVSPLLPGGDNYEATGIAITE